MKRRTARIVMALLAAVMGLVIIGVVAIVWLFVSIVDRNSADERAAVRAFDQVRVRFDHAAPIIRLESNGPVVTRRPPSSSVQRIRTLNVLAWDADDGKLTKATVPFWLLRLKDGPFDLSEGGAGFHVSRPIKIRVADVERYGPSLLLDENHGSDHVLVWTD